MYEVIVDTLDIIFFGKMYHFSFYLRYNLTIREVRHANLFYLYR